MNGLDSYGTGSSIERSEPTGNKNYTHQKPSVSMLVMKSTLLIVSLLVLFPVSVQAETWVLGLEEWSRPRSGIAVSQMQPVRNAVTVWGKTPQSSLQIRYPGGEEGSLWAEELSDWLISLGVPAGAIEVLPGSTSEDSVEIALSSSGD